LSKEQKIRFTSDIGKVSRDIDILSNKMDKLRLKAAVAQSFSQKWAFGSSGFSDRAFTRPTGWQSSPAFNRGQMPYQGSMPWFNKSDYGMGGMSHLQGNPVAQRAVATVNSVAQPVSRFRGLIDSINPKLNSFLSSTGLIPPELTRLVSGLGTFGLAIAGAVAAIKMIIHAAKKTFEFGNLVEGSKVQLTQFLGSEKAAIKDISQARKFSLLTPFGPAEVLGATASARQFGIDPFGKNKYGLKGNKTAMDIIGGLASFRNPMTGESIGMGRAAYAVAGGDTRLLRPFGSDVRAAYETAKKSGPLRSEAFTSKFLEELGKLPKVLNMAEAQSNSMLGMWSTIAGFAEEFWMALSGAAEETGVTTFWSQMKDIVRDVRDTGLEIMTYIMPYVTEFGTYLGSIFKFTWDMLKEVWHIIGPVLVPTFKILIQLLRMGWETMKMIFKIVVSLTKILVAMVMAPWKLLNVLTGTAERTQSIIDSMMEFVTGMQVTFQLFGIFIDAIVEKIITSMDRAIAKFEDLVYRIKKWGGSGGELNKELGLDKLTPEELKKVEDKKIDIKPFKTRPIEDWEKGLPNAKVEGASGGSLIQRQINNIIYNNTLPFTPVINTANDSGRMV
jgi:hypothetical protein